jgi:RHS repeat-associated protein
VNAETTLEPDLANVDILPFGAELVAPMDAFSTQSLGGMTNRVITYQYDGMQRLTAADYVEDGQAVRSYDFAYDVSGNRTSETIFDGLTTLQTVYTYNRANQLISMQSGAQAARPFTYDGAGNLLNDGVNGYAYDAANRLTSRYDGLTQISTGFGYNGVGDLVTQTTGGAATNYLLDMNSTLTQLLGEFAPGSDTYYLLGMDIIGQQTNGTWGYFGYDGLGSVRGVFDLAGQYAALTSYAPYGSPFEQYNTPSTLGFTGEQTAAGGLNYLRARYYNPSIGTFLSRDPFSGTTNNAMSRNGYSYVHGNVVNWTDPSGENPLAVAIGIAAIVVVVAALVSLFQQHQLNMNNQSLGQTIQNGVNGGGSSTYRQPFDSLGSPNCVGSISNSVETVLRIVSTTLNVAGGGARDFPGLGVGSSNGTNLMTMEQDDDDAIPFPLNPDRDDDNLIQIWRGVDGNEKNGYFKNPYLRPRDFRPNPARDFDGLSMSELANLPPNSVTPYAYPFTIALMGNKVAGVTATLVEVPACTATYTPQFGEGHWSVNCVGQIDVLLSTFATANRERTILYPSYIGEHADDRRFDWPP